MQERLSRLSLVVRGQGLMYALLMLLRALGIAV